MASYRLSHKPPGSKESHLIRTQETIQNLPNREASALARQMAVKDVSFYPEKYGAKQIGAGAFGTVFLVRTSQRLLTDLQTFFRYGGGKILASYPPVGTPIIIKITKQNTRDSDSSFYKTNVMENVVHKRLFVAPCGKLGTRALCISKYVPKFFMSCIFGRPRHLKSLTVMDSAGDTDLNTFVKGKSVPANLFVEVERAICVMWLNGYIHGDLHRENIMIDTKRHTVKIIDFGFSLKLPSKFVSTLGRRLYRKIASGSLESLGEVWTQKPVNGNMRLINYTNRVMRSRRLPWYNPDYKILRTLWNQVPRQMRKKIPVIRSSAWGIPIDAYQHTKHAV
jgi:serine/threonine protein kinase